jgi:hypothetical protein
MSVSVVFVVALQVIVARSDVLHHGHYLSFEADAVGTREEGADLRFLCEGEKASLVAVNGAKLGEVRGPDIDELTKIDGDMDEEKVSLVRGTSIALGVKTGRGKLALVRVDYPQDEDTHFCSVSYRYRRDGGKAFPHAPTCFEIADTSSGTIVKWQGDEGAAYEVAVRGREGWKIAATVPSPEWAVPAIKGKLLRLRVARALGGGDTGEAVETVVARKLRGVVTGKVDVTDHRTSGTFSFEDSDEDGVADLVLYRNGLAAAAPGGIARAGNGKKAFSALVELPASGYFPEVSALKDGDVLVVRLQDGRYAKLLYQGQAWYQHHFAYELLADGGTVFQVAPRIHKESWDEAKGLELRIDGKKLPEGSVYQIQRSAPGGEPELAGETAEPSFVDKHAPKKALLTYSVVVKGPSGRVSAPRTLDVDTYPESWTRGKFTLDGSRCADGYSFSKQAKVDAASGDVAIESAAGGTSSLRLRCLRGGSITTERGARRRMRKGGADDDGATKFGQLSDFDFDDVSEKCSEKTLQSDDREVGANVFWVKWKKGVAQVRIVKRGWPEVEFEYVLIPKEEGEK